MATEDLNDGELEALLNELATTPEDRALLLEEHRQLEKDLLRLADPLPPPDFVGQVMHKVATAPPRPVSRADVLTALGVISGALCLALGALVLGGSSSASPGVGLAQLTVQLQGVLVAIGSGLLAVWRTAALPLVAGLAATLLVSLSALKRLATPQLAGKVVP
jgi:hypothetical protein